MEKTSNSGGANELWPALPLEAWKDTRDTLHMWTQIVGKVKLELCPFLSEWWEVALYVSARGMTTSRIPYNNMIFEVNFDFIDHNLFIVTSDGRMKGMPLVTRSVADFYREFMTCLRSLGIDVTINPKPSEVQNAIPFDQDSTHASYDAEYVHRFWRTLVQITKVFEQYRTPFIGKSSPVQFFWGSFDLTETRFSGRRASPPAGADKIIRLSEIQEQISAGFWTGTADGKIQEPAFYAYAYPEPDGLKTASVRPSSAYYDTDMGEFILKYEDVRKASSPEQAIMEFLNSTFEAGARLAHWDLNELEEKTQ